MSTCCPPDRPLVAPNGEGLPSRDERSHAARGSSERHPGRVKTPSSGPERWSAAEYVANRLRGVTIIGALFALGFAYASLLTESAPSIWDIGLVLAAVVFGFGLIGLVLCNASASFRAEPAGRGLFRDP